MVRPAPKPVDVGGVGFDLWTRETLVQSLPEGLVGAEIGVQHGAFSRTIIDGCKPRLMYLVDCWEFSHGITSSDTQHLKALRNALDEVAREMCDGTVRVVPAWSRDGAQWVEDNTLDFIYIDGDHRLSGIRSDLAMWVPKVKPGGWVLGHDTQKPAIMQALKEYTKQKIILTEHNNSFVYQKEAS
jgi:hypothetical protein